jgi:hypothetical protein
MFINLRLTMHIIIVSKQLGHIYEGCYKGQMRVTSFGA